MKSGNLTALYGVAQSVGGTVVRLFSFTIDTEDGQPWETNSETVKYLNNLYKIISKPLTWHGALKECLKENMRLVSITDPYQQAFLSVHANLRNSSFWIGLSSQDVSSPSRPSAPLVDQEKAALYKALRG